MTELPGGWTLDDLAYITRYIVHTHRPQILDTDEARDVVAVELVARLYTDPETPRQELFKAGHHALAAANGKEMAHSGLDGQEGRRPRWAMYWRGQRALAAPFEDMVLDRIAVWQVWHELSPRHQETLSALITAGDNAAASELLGIPRSTWGVRLKYARDRARELWYWPEAPGRQWGNDFPGRGPDAKGRNRAVERLARRRRQAA